MPYTIKTRSGSLIAIASLEGEFVTIKGTNRRNGGDHWSHKYHNIFLLFLLLLNHRALVVKCVGRVLPWGEQENSIDLIFFFLVS